MLLTVTSAVITATHFQSVPQKHMTFRRPANAAAEDAECTFAPALNPASEALLEGSAAVPADFFRRQRHFHDLQQRRLAALQSQVRSCSLNTQSATFHAALLTPNSNLLKHHHALRKPVIPPLS